MKKILIVFIVVLFAMVSFAETAKTAPAKPAAANGPDLQFEKRVQFFKMAAGEEMKLLTDYSKCLDTVKTKPELESCISKRKTAALELRKHLSHAEAPKDAAHIGAKAPAVPAKK